MSKCKTCSKDKVVVPKGFKVCNGGCGKVLEENGDNFPGQQIVQDGFFEELQVVLRCALWKEG